MPTGKQIGMLPERQTQTEATIQEGRQARRHSDNEDRQKGRRTERKTGKVERTDITQMGRETDKETDEKEERQIKRQEDRQTDKKTDGEDD